MVCSISNGTQGGQKWKGSVFRTGKYQANSKSASRGVKLTPPAVVAVLCTYMQGTSFSEAFTPDEQLKSWELGWEPSSPLERKRERRRERWTEGDVVKESYTRHCIDSMEGLTGESCTGWQRSVSAWEGGAWIHVGVCCVSENCGDPSVLYTLSLSFPQSFVPFISDPCPRVCRLVTVWVDIIEYSMRTLALQPGPLKP